MEGDRMSFEKYKELLLGIIMLAVSIVYFVAATMIEIKIQTAINSRYIPYLLAGIAFILGILQCINGYKAVKNYKETEKEPSDTKSVIIMFFLIVVYCATLKTIGFLISTSVLMFLQMILLCPINKKRNLPLFAFISIVSTVIMYYAFRLGLNLMLPSGLLG